MSYFLGPSPNGLPRLPNITFASVSSLLRKNVCLINRLKGSDDKMDQSQSDRLFGGLLRTNQKMDRFLRLFGYVVLLQLSVTYLALKFQTCFWPTATS
jgi:hypothetical protein